jgi:histone-binding protein RBBP4
LFVVYIIFAADSVINIWDLRNLTKPIAKLEGGHTDQVLKVEWAPFNESILGSGGADRRVALWDLSRIGQEQSSEDALDGPPELLFLHGGHTAKVSDFSWNAKMDWCIASVAEDNVLQIWTPVEEIYVEADDEEDEDEDEDEDEGAAEPKGAVEPPVKE